TITATQTDAAGNESDPSDEVTITVDLTAPDPLNVTGPADGDEVLTDRPTFRGTGEPGALVTITDMDGNVICTTTVAGDGSWSCVPTAALADGDHRFRIVQTDAAGNVSADTFIMVSVNTKASLALDLWGTYDD